MYKLNLAPYERMTTNLGPSNEMYVMDLSLKMRFRMYAKALFRERHAL